MGWPGTSIDALRLAMKQPPLEGLPHSMQKIIDDTMTKRMEQIETLAAFVVACGFDPRQLTLYERQHTDPDGTLVYSWSFDGPRS